MVALREESFGNYSRMMVVQTLNADVLENARRIFSEYKMREVVLNNSFDDDVWKISDEKRISKLMGFELPQVIAPWIACSVKEFRLCIKAYLAFHLGELMPHTLQDMTRTLFRLPAMDVSDVAILEDYTNHIISFLQLLPGGSAERDWVIECFSERESTAWSKSGKGRQRILSDFNTYLRFNDIIADYWQSAGKDEKLFYFPLYFWWSLAAILPLRVTELLLTPRECLEERDGKFIITVRRSKLKGSGRKIAYRIAEDYELCKYEITIGMGYELQRYLDVTDNMAATQLDTLFRIEPHYTYLSAAMELSLGYYTYENLNTCMRSFFKEIIVPSGAEINPIKLGDTRHIAMINLIISGGSPVICRELANHADINISSHYYANISNLVECVTLERLRKRKGSEAVIAGKQKYSLSTTKGLQRVIGGFCESETYQNRDISECLKTIGADGQIGECSLCPHFRPNEQGLRLAFSDSSAAKAAVDKDSRYLMQTIELVRKGLGHQENIGAALLRLQHSGNRYSMSIQERLNNGKT
jgi:hypothetical protein